MKDCSLRNGIMYVKRCNVHKSFAHKSLKTYENFYRENKEANRLIFLKEGAVL